MTSEYDTATARFADVVTKLQWEMSALSKDEYDRRARSVDEARIKPEEARIAVERHIGTHGC